MKTFRWFVVGSDEVAKELISRLPTMRHCSLRGNKHRASGKRDLTMAHCAREHFDAIARISLSGPWLQHQILIVDQWGARGGLRDRANASEARGEQFLQQQHD